MRGPSQRAAPVEAEEADEGACAAALFTEGADDAAARAAAYARVPCRKGDYADATFWATRYAAEAAAAGGTVPLYDWCAKGGGAAGDDALAAAAAAVAACLLLTHRSAPCAGTT